MTSTSGNGKHANAEKRQKREEDWEQRARNGGKTDEELDLENFNHRTLGAACMYGAKGAVIFRSRGARRKGDPMPMMDEHRVSPATLARAKAKSKSTMRQTIQHKSPKKGR